MTTNEQPKHLQAASSRFQIATFKSILRPTSNCKGDIITGDGLRDLISQKRHQQYKQSRQSLVQNFQNKNISQQNYLFLKAYQNLPGHGC